MLYGSLLGGLSVLDWQESATYLVEAEGGPDAMAVWSDAIEKQCVHKDSTKSKVTKVCCAVVHRFCYVF